ncbi:hypothetical protein [Pseudalkalibacillus sp. SCS-8]|uniref:hypothetical protein n=1 Tax=Pseudalkalibacillus nanhaiensis TaxID=3115291 RepID=UPI0032DACC56
MLFNIFVEGFINIINGIYKVVIPLSFTIFIFAYREQREVAYSLLKRKKKWQTVSFIVSSILLLIAMQFYSYHLQLSSEQVPTQTPGSTKENAKNVTNLDTLALLTIMLISLWWIISSVTSYRSILKNINIIDEFRTNTSLINKAFKKIDKIMVIKEKNEAYKAKEIQKQLDNIIVATEINFQILITKEKYKLTNNFSSSLRTINSTLFNKLVEYNKDEEIFSKIVPLSGTKYFDLYILILKNLSNLLEVSLETGREKEVQLINDTFCDIKPFLFQVRKEDYAEWIVYKRNDDRYQNLEFMLKEFFNHYYFIMYKILLNLYKKNDSRTTYIFERLIAHEFDNRRFISENDFLTLTSALFYNSIETRNLKVLTDITNNYFKFFIKSLEQENLRKPENKIPKTKFSKRISVKKITNQKIHKSEDIQRKIVKIMIFGIIKSIELGHYNCAGFLIKVIIKNFDQKLLNYEITDIFKNRKNTTPDLTLSKEITSHLSINLSFSPASYKYCLQKTVLLLALQQRFVSESMKIININKQNYINLDKFFGNEDKSYLEYLIEKVKGLQGLYGLLCLKDDNIDNLISELDNKKKSFLETS